MYYLQTAIGEIHGSIIGTPAQTVGNNYIGKMAIHYEGFFHTVQSTSRVNFVDICRSSPETASPVTFAIIKSFYNNFGSGL